MNFSVKVNCFIIFILCPFVSCEAKNWLCAVESSNESVHEYICETTKWFTDRFGSQSNCHLISADFNLPSKNSKVTKLTIKHCAINVIVSWLKSYENVISLNSSHNKIGEIPRNFFANLPEIIEVDFSYNSIEKIGSKAFKGADKLTTIHLSYNAISSISSESFASLKDLEYVDLSNNDLKVPDDVFNENTKLKVLHIESNADEASLPIIPFAISVHTSWKELTTLDLDQLDQKLRIFANSSDEGYFRTSDEFIDFHCNEQSFVNVERLTVGRNQIEYLHDLFECFGSSADETLKNMDLSDNPVRNMNSSIFSRFRGLTELKLGNTQLDSFDFATLQHLPNMEVLDISGNGLKTFENLQLLSTFNSLRQLFIHDNSLKNIPEIIDNLSPSIEWLDLSGNFVGDISRINFGKLEKLGILFLGNTSLQLNNVDPFEENTNLGSIYLNDNNLANWNVSSMAKTLYKLTGFAADGCQIDPIEIINHFGSNIQGIILSNNHLKEFKMNSIKSNEIAYLILANMGMEKFEVDGCSPAEINISGNNLTELNNFDKLHLPTLNSLNIEGNNFPCEYLTQFLRKIEIEWPDLEMNGDPYKQKHGDDCHPSIRNITIT